MPRQTFPLYFANVNAGSKNINPSPAADFKAFLLHSVLFLAELGFTYPRTVCHQEQDCNSTPQPLASRRVFPWQMFHVFVTFFSCFVVHLSCFVAWQSTLCPKVHKSQAPVARATKLCNKVPNILSPQSVTLLASGILSS